MFGGIGLGGLGLVRNEGVGALRGDVWLDFGSKPDGAPTYADTGQPVLWDVPASANTIVVPTISGGALVASAQSVDGTTTAAYPGIRLKEDVKSFYMEGTFGDGNDTLAAVSCADVKLSAVVDSSLHITFTYAQYQVGRWSQGVYTQTTTAFGSTVPFNTRRRMGWRISGNDVIILLPTGEEVTVTDAAIATRTNHCIVFEPFRGVAGVPGGKIYAVAANLFADPVAAGRTNLLSQRNNVSNAAWNKSQIGTITAGQADADGGVLADQVLESAVNNFHNVYQTKPKGASAIKRFTLRARVKGVGRSWAALQAFNGGFSANGTIYFDIATPAIGSQSGTFTQKTFMAYSMGNGWVQIQMDFLSDADANLVGLFGISSGDLGSGSYLGDVTKGLLMYDQWMFERPL